MNNLLLGSVAGTLLGWLMGCLSLFLIMLILIQRGKGGGLAGALGGPGGQSAFGSKAGDTFTLITVVVASIWAFTCAFTMWLLGAHAPATAVTDTQLKAGPGEIESSDALTVPPIGGEAVSGLSQGGIGATLDAEASDEAAESLELTPAKSTDPENAESEDEAKSEANDDTKAESNTESDAEVKAETKSEPAEEASDEAKPE